MIKLYLQNGYLTSLEVEVVERIAKSSHHHIDDIILACGFASYTEIAKIKAARLDTDFIDLSGFTPELDILELIPSEKAIEYSLLPLKMEGTTLVIAVDENSDYQHKEELEYIASRDIRFVIASKGEILKQLLSHHYYNRDDTTRKKIEEIKSIYDNTTIINLVNLLIEDAIEDNASDIHISPEADMVNIFYRINGVRKHYHVFPKEFQKRIISRLKIMSGLDITNKKLPQDGSIEYNFRQMHYRLRVSSIRTTHGENIVIRILKNSTGIDIKNLGLNNTNIELLKELFKQPAGLILVTGPTGSGKTTTLYATLKEIDSLSKNITTVEDPIEYQIPFVTQTQINNDVGYTFDKALRAFMRQDPDVIFVGEIRDKETAELAMRASVTGHLVLSTLHTNDAVGAIARLSNLNIPNYLIGSATLAVISQRLVRTLCPHCKRRIANPQKEFVKHQVSEHLLSKYKEFTIYDAVGCSHCFQTGYNSREVIVEILLIDKTIEDMIIKSTNVTDILQYAKSKGFSPLLDDAHVKVLEGITSFEEVSRVVLARKFA